MKFYPAELMMNFEQPAQEQHTMVLEATHATGEEEWFCPECRRGRLPFLLSITPPKLHPKIHLLYIQEVVDALCASNRHAWVDAFAAKYGLA